ncbi:MULTISPECIES: sugar-binding transcriptional regulator [unclassified Ruegeria]|uniref:sugar-binding transcriptional regulator n=1 Tax=unclassified Ruegeria TaxID=2625375 RepID=UPI00148A112D|nr:MULTISPECIES: sugar-binding transcriptional regulator [unclassified Ruegeria]
MVDKKKDFELIRQIHTVLVLHYLEGQKQADIARALNLSNSKVNRLITQGRKMGMVKIDIESPFETLMDIERDLTKSSGLSEAIVTPSVAGSEETTLQQVGRAAANHLIENLSEGDVIAITGGKAVSATVEALEVERAVDVTVVPLTGGIQGKYYTDVNHLATQMAERLGGKTMLLHAPLFAESRDQRDMLEQVSSIREVLDLARHANVALVGVGSIEPEGSSYYDLHPVPEADRKMLMGMGVIGEFLAHLIHIDGSVSNYALNSRLVSVSPNDLAHCKRVIGVTAGAQKVLPIKAVLNGKFLNSLILDESTATAVLREMEGARNVA